ncbi:MAG: alpha/beta hydrolase [Gammaproteobacteria bacterium]
MTKQIPLRPLPYLPALALSVLTMFGPSDVPQAAEPGVQVQTRLEDRKLNGWWTKVDEPRATVLMLHGTMAHANMEIMATLAAVFAEYRIESLRVSLSLGIDDRYGMLDCGVVHGHRHGDAVDELAAWFRWLEDRDRRDSVLLGHSRGTNQVARYAASQALPAPKALVLVAPGIRDNDALAAGYAERGGQALASLLERAAELVDSGRGDELLGPVPYLHCDHAQVTAASFLSYYADEPGFDTLALAAGTGLPVLIFAGSEDPPSRGVGKAVIEYQGDSRLDFVEIDGADHFFRDLYAYDLVEAVEAWLGGLGAP